jgi:hypothetical protein
MIEDEEGYEDPDLRGPAIVIKGSFLSRFRFIGPFQTVAAASEWCDNTISGKLGVGNHTVVLLEAAMTQTER